MRCPVCGGARAEGVTDLPLKVGDISIVVIRALPVLQCGQCGKPNRRTTRWSGSIAFLPQWLNQQISKSRDTLPDPPPATPVS